MSWAKFYIKLEHKLLTVGIGGKLGGGAGSPATSACRSERAVCRYFVVPKLSVLRFPDSCPLQAFGIFVARDNPGGGVLRDNNDTVEQLFGRCLDVASSRRRVSCSSA